MVRFRFFQLFQLKVSFLLSLLVILFLLLSFVFQTPDNIPLANLIQSINRDKAWSNILLENLTIFPIRLVETQQSYHIFWHINFYNIIELIMKFKGQMLNLYPGAYENI